MHDGGGSALANRAPHSGGVANVAFDHRRVERGTAMTSGEIVVDDDAVTGTSQRLGGVTANVPGAAGDEDGR
jgi:hypothetical protein